MALWVGVLGQVASAKNMSPLCRHPQRTPNSKRKKIFKLNYKTFRIRRWFEQLSSSIGWQVMLVQSSTKKVVVKGGVSVCGA